MEGYDNDTYHEYQRRACEFTTICLSICMFSLPCAPPFPKSLWALSILVNSCDAGGSSRDAQVPAWSVSF